MKPEVTYEHLTSSIQSVLAKNVEDKEIKVKKGQKSKLLSFSIITYNYKYGVNM